LIFLLLGCQNNKQLVFGFRKFLVLGIFRA
jgi:hypothetical protein